MRTFRIIWLGQVVSRLGSGTTNFALMIWVWDQTGQATPVVLVGVLSGVSFTLAQFVAGPLVDRWNRQRVVIGSDLIAALTSLIIFALLITGHLRIWNLYVMGAIASGVGAFQSLAFQTSISLLVPGEHYTRASGMMSLAEYIAVIGAPLVGGVLMSVTGISTVLVWDMATFLFAVGTLLIVRIPQPPPTASAERESLLQEALFGFRYVFRQPGMVGLLLIAFAFTFAESLGYPLITPLILARTGGSEMMLATVRAVQGAAGIVGGVIVASWGGPKRRIHGVLLGIILTSLLGDGLMGLGRGLVVFVVAAFSLELFIPVMIASYHAIWQSKVEPAHQGRVFAARDIMSTMGEPVAMLTGGLLSDGVFEPAMTPDGVLAGPLSPIVGSGPGAGMGLMLLICGLLAALAGLSGYLLRPVREIETLLPDHEYVTRGADSG